MEKLEIVLEQENSDEVEIELISEGTIIYPELEDLEVTPSSEEQNFKSEKYGYNNVKVKATSGVNVDITNCNYLFAYNSRNDIIDELLKLCKNATTTYNMFYYSTALTELDLSNFDTSKVTLMTNMFDNCQKLTSLNLSNFNTSNVTNMSYMFNNCYALKDLDFAINLGKGYTQKTANYSNYKLDLSKSSSLTHDSLMNVINKLYDLNLTYDVANDGTLYKQQLVLGSTNLAKLTEEEKAIATNKGWVVS